jgi:CBS domain containing-hemolysin-like protein
MVLLILYLFVALFFSFMCSVLEAVLLSITPSYIGALINKGKRSGYALQRLKNKIDRPLSAILTLNTFAHTIGAAGVGARAQKIWGNEYVSVVSAVLTLLILIFSEIIPKTLGANYWKQLAPLSAPLLQILIHSPLYPFIVLSNFISRVLRKPQHSHSLNRAEVEALAERGVREGVFDRKESRILLNLMRFNSLYTKTTMTPRTIIVAAAESRPIREFYRSHDTLRVSRIPVYRDSIDTITGYVLKDDILEHIIAGTAERPLSSIRRDILIVPQHMPLMKLFYRLINHHTHIAAVVGEYGETVGLITMEDVIETLVGIDIMDEQDSIRNMQREARKKWKRRVRRMGLITTDETSSHLP